jgi:Domain of unknown function (DUF4145)
MMKETFGRRFMELETSFSSLRFVAYRDGITSGTHVEQGQWQGWATSSQSLILAVFGAKSPHYENFTKVYNHSRGADQSLNTLNAIFRSAKEDFEGGYVFEVDLRVSGEVFGDIVALARRSLAEGNKDVAAVLACAALEDALKRFAAVKELDVNEKNMEQVVNALKSAGLVSGAQKTLLEAMPRIRNFAMHADWTKISEPDVNSVIGFVEQFLLTKFSGD